MMETAQTRKDRHSAVALTKRPDASAAAGTQCWLRRTSILELPLLPRFPQLLVVMLRRTSAVISRSDVRRSQRRCTGAGYVRHPFVSCTFLIDIISGWLGLVWLFIELDATRSRHTRPPPSPLAPWRLVPFSSAMKPVLPLVFLAP